MYCFVIVRKSRFVTNLEIAVIVRKEPYLKRISATFTRVSEFWIEREQRAYDEAASSGGKRRNKRAVIILMIIDVSSCPIMVGNRVFRDCERAEGKLLD